MVPSRRWRSRWPGLFLITVAVGLSVPVGAADPPPAKTDPNPLKKVPPGTVVVIVNNPEDGKKIIPNSVMITQEEYQNLLNQIEQLKAQLKPDKPIAPGACDVTGDATGTIVHLTLVFQIITEKPNTTVALGCKNAILTDAKLDDKLPQLQDSDDGFVLTVEKPGKYSLKLHLDVSTTAKGGDRGFDLDLPRAPQTTLALTLPDKVKEVRITTDVKDLHGPSQVVKTPQAGDKTPQLEKIPIGAVGRLELAWKNPASVPSATPLLAAEGKAIVRVGELNVLTEIDLTLHVLRGQTSQWQILLPPGATLAKPTLPDDRLAAYEPPTEKNPAHVLKLHGSSTEPLAVRFLVNQPRSPDAPRPAGKPAKDPAVAIGPFFVLGTYQQEGTLLVTAPADIRSTFQVRGEPFVTVTQRELTDEDRRQSRAIAGFNYVVHNPDAKATINVPPFLNLEVEAIKELSAARARHTIRLTDRGWIITSDIDVTPLRAGGVERVELTLPAGYELDTRKGAQVSGPGSGSPATETARIDHNPASRSLTISPLARRLEPFRITIEGLFPGQGGAGSGPWQSAMDLPLPIKVEDRGGQILVTVPHDMELVNPGEDPAWVNLPPGKSEHSWPSDRFPERVEVSWQSNRPEAAAVIVADVRLSSRQGQVLMKVWPPNAPGELLLLWLPDGLTPDRVRISPKPLDDKLLAESVDVPKRSGFRPWQITLPANTIDKDHPLTLEYAFGLLEPAEEATTRRIVLPLIRAGKTPWADVKVRIASPPGTTVSLVGGPWDEQPLEVGDSDTLPALVIRNSGHKADQPPVLGLRESGLGLGAVQIDRVLVQASVAETGAQHCRARFLIKHLGANHLDVELPSPTAMATLKAFLKLPGEPAREVVWVPLDETTGSPTVRLQMGPELVRTTAVLDLSYQLPPSAGRTLAGALLETTLTPPLPRGGLGRMTVRWQVDLPPTWVAAVHGGGAVEQTTWGWRDWLIAPRPYLRPGELEDWFLNGFEQSSEPNEATPTEPTGLVWWQSRLTPIQVIHVPQQGWLLFCSLGLLLMAVVLYLLLLRGGMLPGREDAKTGARGARFLFWMVLIALATVTAAGLLFWPSVLGTVIYGCEPGLVVVLLVAGVQWGLHQRYRRQVVFMPGFSRRKPGSSLSPPRETTRTGSHPPSRPRSEPSTVDAPPQPPS